MRVFHIAVVSIHLLAAATWLGSMAFLAFVLVPALRSRPEGLRRELVSATGLRLRGIAWWLFGVLAVTGTVQLYLRGYRLTHLTSTLWDGPFGAAFAAKMICFVAVLGLAGWHDFSLGPRALAASADPASLERMRRLASIAGRTIFLLGVLIFVCAVALVRGGFQ